jgi:hypothetical protein
MDQPPAPAFRPENQSDPYPPTPPSGWKIPDNKFEKPENYPHAKIVNWVGKKLKVRIPPYNFFLDQSNTIETAEEFFKMVNSSFDFYLTKWKGFIYQPIIRNQLPIN